MAHGGGGRIPACRWIQGWCGLNRWQGALGRLGVTILVVLSAAALLLVDKAGRKPPIKKLRLGVLSICTQADYRAARLEIVGTNGDDANVIEVCRFKTGDSYSGILRARVAN